MNRLIARLRKLALLAVGMLIGCFGSVGPSQADYLVGWGLNDEGQATVPAGDDFVAVAAGWLHSLALKSDGSLVGWGDNSFLQQATPPTGNDFAAAACGWLHSVALRTDGSLIAWGDSDQTNPPTGNDFVEIAAADFYNLALKEDGSLAGWGTDFFGQSQFPSRGDYAAVALGTTHGLGLMADRSLTAWGGEVPEVTTVPGGNDYVAIAAGFNFSVALKEDGSLVGWGNNDHGEIDVPGGNDFVAIAAGYRHSLALKADGSLVGWGSDGSGQSGVPAGNDFVAIAAGDFHSLAIVQPTFRWNANLNNDGDWFGAASNWEPDGRPTAAHRVILQHDGGGTIGTLTVSTGGDHKAITKTLEINCGTVNVTSTGELAVIEHVAVAAGATLNVDGILNAGSGSVAGTLAGNGIIDVFSIDVSGTVSPGGGDDAAGALTIAAGSELVFEAGTYNAEVSLSDLASLAADKIVNTKVDEVQGTLIITGGTLAPKGVGRTDSGLFSPTTTLVVVDNTQGGILEGVGDNREFAAVTPTPAADDSAHIGQGAFLREVTYEDNGFSTTAVKLDVFVALEGDVDGNGMIGLDDWDTFRNNFGKSDTNWTQGNFDSWSDVTIDLDDWDRFRNRFGQTYPIDGAASAAAAVPEPGTIVMLLGGFAGLLACVWRRR